jgi:RND family efflux transporter MFP subunit
MSRTVLRHTGIARSAAYLTALFGIGLLTASCKQAPPPAAFRPEVTVAPVVVRDVADEDEFTGHFESVNAVEIRPRVAGFVQRVAFREGATVQKGDALFVIDPRPYEAEAARAEAELERARTKKQLADMEVERAQRLVSTQAISREELDSRISGRAESDAAIRVAEAAVRMARLNLDWTIVRAPISGRVSRAEVTTGNLVQAGPAAPTLLTTIVSLDPIYVYFDSDEQAYLKYMRVSGPRPGGRPVYVALANETGFPHEGRLDFIDNRVDRTAGTIRLRAVLSNPSHLFAPGLFARVRVTSGDRKPAALIQDQSVGTDQDRKFVLVLKADSTVEYRPVTLGRMVGGLRTVQSGLKPGEHVVINGLMRVRPGMKVAAKSTAMTSDVAALTRSTP